MTSGDGGAASDPAAERFIETVRFVRSGGDLQGVTDLLDGIDVPDGEYDEVIGLLLGDLYATTAALVISTLRTDPSPSRVADFVAVIEGSVRQVSGVDKEYVGNLINYCLRLGPAMKGSYQELAAYFVLQGLLAPFEEEGLLYDRRAYRKYCL